VEQGRDRLPFAAQIQEHDVDGVVGPKTLSALQNIPATSVIEDIARQRAAFYDDIVQRKSSQEKYLLGWKSQAVMTRDRSLSMNRLWA
jgi:lysozyme family protein